MFRRAKWDKFETTLPPADPLGWHNSKMLSSHAGRDTPVTAAESGSIQVPKVKNGIKVELIIPGVG